jgi:hypothetical protein
MLLPGGILIDHGSALNTKVILNADIGGKIHIFSDCLTGARVFFEQQIINLRTCARQKNYRVTLLETFY